MQAHDIVDSEELDRLRAAVTASGDLVYAWSLKNDQICWSGNLVAVFGPTGGARVATGVAFEKKLHPEDRSVRRETLTQHIQGAAAFDCEYRLLTDSGEYCWVHDRGCARLAADGTPDRLTGILRVITERKRNEARLEEKASFDELTGHFNRQRLRAALDHALAYAQRYESPGAYIAIGIDNLSGINDAFGYQAADAVLVEVGQRLDRNLRTSDVIGRLDGDRFGIVVSHCAENDLGAVAEKILESVRAAPMDTPSGPVQATISAGGVVFPTNHEQTAQDIMRRTDVALLEAKRLGRDCFVPYQDSAQRQHDRRRDVVITKQVQLALKTDQLLLAYQPIVRAADGKISFYECLLRMVGEDGALVPAGVFVPVIERMGLIRTVDRRVLAMAVEELTRSVDVVLAINASALTTSDRPWLRLLVASLKNRPDLAERLIVEITETVALHDLDETARFVAAVRALGCRVALDDFGAGYTSFQHLKTLAVDIVKIDGSFVRNLAHDLDNQLFIRTLLSLAKGFNLQTVAECVETAEDVTYLTEQGVELLQGYYFGKPSVKRLNTTRLYPNSAITAASPAA